MHSIEVLYLEELHSNTSKHELQECGDNHDVADGPDGHKYTLHHMLQRDVVINCQFKYTELYQKQSPRQSQRGSIHKENGTHSWRETLSHEATLFVFYLKSLGSVNGPQWTENSQNTKNFHH